MEQLSTTPLWRPVGEAELRLIKKSDYRAFPPRLPDQPIFYPVCNERYATEIAQRWNARDGKRGFVTRFAVRSALLEMHERQVVGAPYHEEYWIPAEELEVFNRAIVGQIEVVASFD